MENKPITPLAAGLILGLTSVILFLVYYFTGLIFQQDWVAWLPAFVYIILVIVFINLWSNSHNNFVTYGSCFGFGFRTIAIASIIVFLFTALFLYLTPDYRTQMLQMMKEKMRQNKQVTDEQVDKGMSMISGNFFTITLGSSLFANVLMGLIASLIGAAVARKKPVDPFTQINQTGDIPS